MSALQLDFLHKLAAIARRAITPQTRIAAPPRAPEVEPLQVRARALLQQLGCAALAEHVVVKWNPRMRSTAGTAHPGRALITLNPRLRDFGEEEVDRTMRHELAHLLAHFRAGRKRIAPHGPEWRAACLELGLRDERRCHDLPLPRRQQQRKHRYQCPHCRAEIARARPLRKSACLPCCRLHNGGRYDERFRLRKLPLPSARQV